MFKLISKYIFIGTLSVIPIIIVFQLVLILKDYVINILIYINNITNNYISTIITIFLVNVILFLIGYSTVKFGKSMFISSISYIFNKIPLINTIYSILEKLFQMFNTDNEKNIKEVVFIEYPKNDIWVPAYVTNKINNNYILFVPTSPNPTSGFTIIINKNKIKKTNLTIEEATSFIISIGVDLKNKEKYNLFFK